MLTSWTIISAAADTLRRVAPSVAHAACAFMGSPEKRSPHPRGLSGEVPVHRATRKTQRVCRVAGPAAYVTPEDGHPARRQAMGPAPTPNGEVTVPSGATSGREVRVPTPTLTRRRGASERCPRRLAGGTAHALRRRGQARDPTGQDWVGPGARNSCTCMVRYAAGPALRHTGASQSRSSALWRSSGYGLVKVTYSPVPGCSNPSPTACSHCRSRPSRAASLGSAP